MKSKKKNMARNKVWPKEGVVDWMHLMQSPFPMSDDRCASEAQHDSKEVDQMVRTDLVQAYLDGADFTVTWTGAIIM